MNQFRYIVRVLTMLALGWSAHAAAAPYCASNAGSLTAYFSLANSGDEGSTQEIRIVRGSYTLSSSLEFAPAGSKDNKRFILSGGWAAGCADGSQVLNPANTVLTFNGASADDRNVSMTGDNASYRVEGIRFVGFSEFQINDPTCYIFDSCPDTDSIQVRLNEFRGGTDVYISTQDARELAITNNLFDEFVGNGKGSLVTIIYRNDETKPNISFNTFANMQCNGYSLVNMAMEKEGAIFHHNILQGSGCSNDLYVQPGLEFGYAGYPVAMRYNLYTKLGGLSPSELTGNLVGVDPGFANPANHDYTLRSTAPVSPAIDAGMTLTELILDGLTFPGQDLDGSARLVGAAFDLGAHEAPGTSPDELVVINTNDSGSGSLRAAITAANQQAGKQTITFNIAGSCPRRIVLQTELPEITGTVEIDGYSQPGSKKNTADIGNTATICVVVGPASGSTLQYGMRVPDTAPNATQLTLRGIGFTGGHSVALYLRGGSGHIIQGNAFGGVRPGSYDALGNDNVSHLVLRGEALGALVGGDSPDDRNWFGSSQLNAILLLDSTSGGHTLRNNYIGLDPGGGVPQAIGGNAISAQDSPDNTIQNNRIAAADAGIRISGPSAKGYVIQGNTFGLDAYGGAGAGDANEEGILITNGSGGHTIGSFSGTARSNIITNSRGAGIWIDATAGIGTVVRPNSIYGNGSAGSGLGIDLGALGPLANDVLDADGGANAGQNAPTFFATSINADGTRELKGRLASNVGSTYRIDVYRSPGCPGGNRGGDAKTRLTTLSVTTDASTGRAAFAVTVNGVDAPGFVTAIATNTATGSTSEIGTCLTEDTIFRDGVEAD